MGQILVRNLDEITIQRLKTRAARTQKSLEQMVREILAEFARPSRAELVGEIDRIRARQPKNDVDTTAMIRAWRDSGSDDADC
jgi:hypothetical protein